MKKLILLFTLYLTVQNITKAQYHPMLADTTYWCMGLNFLPVHAPESRWFSYERVISIGDTTIGSTGYKKVKTFIWSPPATYFGAWREDTTTQRVYYVHGGESTEQLMYDFSLNLGDTINLDLQNNFYSNLLDGDYIVDSVAMVTIRAGVRKYLRLHNPLNPLLPDGKPFKLEWIESVGEIHDPLYLYMNDEDSYGPLTWDCNNHYSTAIIKQVQGTSKNYVDICSVSAITSMSAVIGFDTCAVNYFSSTNDLNNSLLQTTVYPNPNNGREFTIDIYANQKLTNVAISIIDISGKQVYYSINNIFNESLTIQNCILEKGIYTVQILQQNALIGRSKMVVD